MENTLEQSTYIAKNILFTFNKWEFFVYLIIAFIVGYLIHYIVSRRRDYVRAPRKKKAFYYNNSLSGGYYPNSEPILPRKIIHTQPIIPVDVQVSSTPTQKQIIREVKKEPKKQIPVRSTKDDLKKIEGIGPKIEELLNNADIHTWYTLSKSSISKLKQILTNAGKRFQMHDPATWPEQAHLAETGRWKELQEYQDFLNGGKHLA